MIKSAGLTFIHCTLYIYILKIINALFVLKGGHMPKEMKEWNKIFNSRVVVAQEIINLYRFYYTL